MKDIIKAVVLITSLVYYTAGMIRFVKMDQKNQIGYSLKGIYFILMAIYLATIV